MKLPRAKVVGALVGACAGPLATLRRRSGARAVPGRTAALAFGAVAPLAPLAPLARQPREVASGWRLPQGTASGGRPAVRCQSTAASASEGQRATDMDPLSWLEEVEGEQALGWVRGQNDRAFEVLGKPERSETYRRILQILDSQDKIPYVGRIGKFYYNFWQDTEHEKGIWRRTTLESYRSEKPDWQIVLDLDKLSQEESKSWVWGGYDALDEGPGSTWDRALITLSDGGSDAVVVREFDLEKRSFIPVAEGGFEVPEAKSSVAYRTRNELLVGTDFGEGSLTTSGYPRVSKSWRRGTPLDKAVTVFEGAEDDISADQYFYYDRGFWHEFQHRALDFYHTAKWYRSGDPSQTAADDSGSWRRIPVPDDAGVGTFADSALITLRSDWEVGGTTFPSGSLLSLPLKDCVEGRFGEVQVLFTPSERSSLQASAGTRNFMVLSVLNNVRTELQFWEYAGSGKWSERKSETPGGGIPVGCEVSVSPVWPADSDDIWLIKDGYLQPDLLQLASAADSATATEDVKAKPAMFNAGGMITEQFEAVSTDGTKVPYFLIRREDAPMDGSTPTLLDGYGGFEIPMTPGYSAGVGAAWLEKGGAKVIANIRGGGEFGPAWHQAALKDKRHKAYEDFEAVARDLIARGVTSPGRLACIGGSNGGLLVGNMLTREGARLFGGVVCQVPLLDMQRYHKLLAGASWMAEYGDPDVPEEWAFIRGFSPYHRLHDHCLQPSSDWICPKVLFTTSTKDDRVHPGHARKMVRRLLDDVPSDRAQEVLYWENIQGGHGGAADNKQRACMWTLTYSFLWRSIGGAVGGAAESARPPPSKL